MKVSLAQSGLTLCEPMGCSPSGSSAHEILQARVLEYFLTQASNLGFLHCRQILYHLSHQRTPGEEVGTQQRVEEASFCPVVRLKLHSNLG